MDIKKKEYYWSDKDKLSSISLIGRFHPKFHLELKVKLSKFLRGDTTFCMIKIFKFKKLKNRTVGEIETNG